MLKSHDGAFKCSWDQTARLGDRGERRPRRLERWVRHFLRSSSSPGALISLGQGRSGLIRSRDVFLPQALVFTPSCKLKPFSTRFAALISATLKARDCSLP